MPPSTLSGPFARVTAANFLFFLNFASFFLLPLHVKALGGSETMVGLVVGSSGVASLLVLPLVGFGIDRLGRRRFFLGGATGMTVAALGYLFVHEIGPGLFALRVLQGVSFAAGFTAAATMAADLAPAGRRARALGFFGISTLLTHAIAPSLGEEIIRRGGFPALFVFAAACSIAATTLMRGVPATGGPRTVSAPLPWRVDRPQRRLAGTMMFAGVGFGAVMTFVPTFVVTHGLGRVAFFYGSYSGTAILTRLAGGGISDSLGRRATILPAFLVLSAAIATLAQVDTSMTLLGAGVLFGAAQGITYPTLHAMLVDLTPPEHIGRSQAMFNGAFNLGIMASAFVFGSVVDAFGHRTMFLCAAAFPIIAAALLYAGSSADG